MHFRFVASVVESLKLNKSNKVNDYNPARLVDCGGDISKRWYVVFYIWNEDTREKERKRLYDVNDFNTAAERYLAGDALVKEINEKLKQGYVISDNQISLPVVVSPLDLSISEIIERHIKNNSKSLSNPTIKDYNTLLNTFNAWLELKKITGLKIYNFSLEIAREFFQYLQDEKEKRDGTKGVANKTFNNYLTYFQTIYNTLENDEYITPKQNILKKIRRKKTKSGSHIPYSDVQLQSIEKEIKETEDFQLLLFIKFLYFTFARPKKEVRLLKVFDIKQDVIFIPPSNAKGDGRFVSIPDELNELIDQAGIRKFNPNFYVFSEKGTPGPEPTVRDFFYKKNRAILEKLKYTDREYTLYSYKHTGNVHLYLATKDIYLCKEQNGHTSVTQTEQYLRKLGLLRNDSGLKNFSFPKAKLPIDSSPVADQPGAGAEQE